MTRTITQAPTIAPRAGKGARMASLRAELDRCLREQAECAAYLRSGGPDKAGAWAGVCDWLLAEVLIRREMGC